MATSADPKPRPSRSVLDYETEDALRKALLAVELNDCEAALQEPASVSPAPELATAVDSPPSNNLDWVLPSYDPETTEVQSMKEELNRLQVLKSYLILDSQREEAFERITSIAARVFKVPIALISLVDLGRQWFMSNRGLGDVRETPRKYAFCAHAIMLKHDVLVVPDATADFRFKDNPLVTGPPHIRFYAGAPLVSPEGYKLGTFCIIDAHTRPNGLSDDEQSTLKDLADMAVEAMVHRRRQLQARENPAQLIAYTAHDLMTPLTGVQLSLSLLKDDDEVQQTLGAHQMELLTTASTCSDLMIRICETAMDSLRKGAVEADDEIIRADRETVPVTKLDELVKSLDMIMEPIPKHVPLVIRLDPSVPPMILSDDLKLFRSALNLLSSAAARTQEGCIHFRIYPREEDTATLVFECEDTAADIPVEEYQSLYQPCNAEDGSLRLCLSSVASLISSLDGLYGFRPRRDSGRYKSGSVFWFSVPLFAPESLALGEHVAVARRNGGPSQLTRKDPILPLMRRSNSSSSVSSAAKMRVPLVVGDILQANAVQESCLRDVFELHSDHSDAGNHNTHNGHSSFVDLNASSSNVNMAVIAEGPSQLSVAATPGGQPAIEDAKPAAQPPETAPAQAPMEDAPSPPPVRQRRALVVDDSLVVRKSLAMALRKMGYDVSQAVNGLEGLKELKKSTFDVVFMDFLMPVLDGFDCVKQYREWEKSNRPNFSQLIIGISAHADKNIAEQGIAAGMDKFRPKPISIKLLMEINQGELVAASARQLNAMEGYVEAKPAARPEPMTNGDSGSPSPGHRKREPEPDPFRIEVPSPKSSSRILSKRPRTNSNAGFHRRSGSNSSNSALPSESLCLIATDRPTQKSSEALSHLEGSGWKVVVVHDGKDALRLLQMRNWDAILMDDELPDLSGMACISKFRDWEGENRVNRQKNVFLVSDVDVPSPFDPHSIVQPPKGFDHVLHKPVSWKDLKQLLQISSQDTQLGIVIKHCPGRGSFDG